MSNKTQGLVTNSKRMPSSLAEIKNPKLDVVHPEMS